MSEAATVRLGYVGLGNIGGPMATRLAAWPGGLTVFDLSDDALAKVTQAGAARSDSVAAVAEAADIIGICVVNDEQVRAVVADLLTTAKPGTIITLHLDNRPRHCSRPRGGLRRRRRPTPRCPYLRRRARR